MSYIFVLPFLPPLFFKHFTMTTKKEIAVLRLQALPGYAGSHDQDLAVTGVTADASTV
jgi:hypothetical protein